MDRKELIVKMGDHCQEHPKARRNLQPFLATKHSGIALSNIIQLLFITKPILPGKFLLSVHIFNFFLSKANKSNKYYALNQNSVVVF